MVDAQTWGVTGIIALILLLTYLYYDKRQFNKRVANEIQRYKDAQKTDTVEDMICILDTLPTCYEHLTECEIKDVGNVITEYHDIIYNKKDIQGLRQTMVHIRKDVKLAKDNLINLSGSDISYVVDKQQYVRNHVRLVIHVLLLYRLEGDR